MTVETWGSEGTSHDSGPRSFDEGIAGRQGNALNALRLILALMVIVGHTSVLSGADWPTWMGQLGRWSVAGFFVISGYLILGSRLRSSWWSYAMRRMARIFPAYWVQLIIVAFVFAPTATLLGASTWSVVDAFDYVAQNFSTFDLHYTLQGTEFPHYDAWNGSAWTLMYELLAYLGCLLVFSVPWCRKHSAIVAAAGLLSTAGLTVLAPHIDITTNLYLNLAFLGSFFCAGMLAFSLRRHLIAKWNLAGLAAGVFGLLLAIPGVDGLTQLPLAYLLLASAVLLPVRFGSQNDLSYGVYIFAFPVQQVIAMIGLSGVFHLVVSTAATLLLAMASWRSVESPALRGTVVLIRAMRAQGPGRRSSRAR